MSFQCPKTKLRGFGPRANYADRATASGVQKLIRGDTQTHTHTHRQQRDLISLLYFFQNKESRVKTPLVRDSGSRSRGPGFDSRRFQIF
jgi:hypothetical protein